MLRCTENVTAMLFVSQQIKFAWACILEQSVVNSTTKSSKAIQENIK